MKTFLSFVLKEAKHILRDRRTMLILFGMPVVLMLLFGFAISNDVHDVRVVVVTANWNDACRQKVERLAASEYFDIVETVGTSSEAERLIRAQQADMSIAFDRHRQIQLVADGADPNMAQLWTAYASSVISAADLPSPVNVRMLYNPRMLSAYNFVPGIMGMLLLLICAMMTSVSIVREKERGTMEVLLVSPVKPLMIIVAKAVPYLIQAFLILIIILIMSFSVLQVPLAGSLLWIIAVSLLYILLALSLGLLISNVAKTQFVALLMSAMVLLLPTVMLSGMLFPVESMPRILQWVAAIVPPRYYIQAMRKLMIMGVGIGDVLREVVILTIMTALLLTVALKKFSVRLED